MTEGTRDFISVDAMISLSKRQTSCSLNGFILLNEKGRGCESGQNYYSKTQSPLPRLGSSSRGLKKSNLKTSMSSINITLPRRKRRVQVQNIPQITECDTETKRKNKTKGVEEQDLKKGVEMSSEWHSGGGEGKYQKTERGGGKYY
ncbi:hypothetical protein BaRGS_00033579 [Batillaria attramentaria]|uniref:Uncharacterized protein n=1 Tax=Batillaria attramentaria TaxID=370345 RepID=A0ABD0JJL5_9CAEN